MIKILQVNNLKKYFSIEKIFSEKEKIVKAVDGVSFSIKKGQIAAIVGESGSGKTTLARCIAGIEIPDEGEIFFEGKLLDFSTKEKRRKIQYIFQDTYGSLNPRIKTGDILAEPIRYHFNLSGEKLKEKVKEFLKKVGLNENFIKNYPHELSGGQRQRIVIARALTMEPKLLIADEPVSNLDVSVQAQILQLFLELNLKDKITILIITHDLRIVYNLADYVIVMKDGKIIESGKTDTIFLNPKSDYTKNLLCSIPNSPYKNQK